MITTQPLSPNFGTELDRELMLVDLSDADVEALKLNIARAGVLVARDQMNQFIRENGFIASEQTLRDFIVERTYVSYDHRDKQLEIGEEEDRPVYPSFRSFKQRYNKYFDQN